MKFLIKFVSFFAILLLSSSLLAQGDIITAKEFKQLIKSNSDLIIIDVNKPNAFKKSHVKNAINVHQNDFIQNNEDIPGLLLPLDQLADYFGKKGISASSEIVIYDAGTQKYSSRVYWVLKYIGANNVKMVHKEMSQWGKARIPLTSQVANHEPVTFTPSENTAIAANLDYVSINSTTATIALVDARHHDEYVGEGDEAYDSSGHIPGAIHLDYKDLLEENGAFKSAEALSSILEKKGITPDKEVIIYCNTGIFAAIEYIALKNILNYNNVKVFEGSYYEWDANFESVN